MTTSYNWRRALRKAITQAGLTLFTQFASLQRCPTLPELWVPISLAGLAFFTTLEKEEESVQGPSTSTDKIRRLIADSLVG